MKKFYTTLLLFAVALTSNAQLRVGLLGGPSSSSVIEKNTIAGWDTTTKPFYSNRGGLHVGFLVQIPLSQRLFLQPGIIYHNKGNKYYKTKDTSQYLAKDSVFLSKNFFTNYIDIPFNLTYKQPLGKKSSFMVSAGPYVSFYYSGKQTFSTRTFLRDSTLKPDTLLPKTLKFISAETPFQVGKAEDKIKTFDLGFNFRAGFDLGKVFITAFYSQGLGSFYKASYEGTFKHKVMGASLGFWLNKSKPFEPKNKDVDKDGVPDKVDACVTVPGHAITKGCPDKDGDGIADLTDICPDAAGVLKYNGCPIPDADNDGINDEEDKCPTQPGKAKYNGCPVPDSDGDGMNDESDACPDKPGIVDFNGCPVPDSDGDGLNDREDKCPTETGLKENYGCPESKKDLIVKINFAARSILFESNKDVLLPESYRSLNKVAAILKNNPNMKLEIEGHTDNTSTPANNMILSQKRANAVKKYLVSQGVDSSRMVATGFGQDKPIADNETPEGKAKNRRVELKLVHN